MPRHPIRSEAGPSEEELEEQREVRPGEQPEESPGAPRPGGPGQAGEDSEEGQESSDVFYSIPEWNKTIDVYIRFFVITYGRLILLQGNATRKWT